MSSNSRRREDAEAAAREAHEERGPQGYSRYLEDRSDESASRSKSIGGRSRCEFEDTP